MADPYFPTNTAAVSWTDGGGTLHLHVFATNGYLVTERVFVNGAWADGTLKQTGAHLSATAWQDGGGAHIRVYCTEADKTVEWCLDGEGSSWYQGAYTTS